MWKILAKVDDARLGRAVAGLVMRALVVEEVERREKEVCALVVSSGKRGMKEYDVGIRDQQVNCSFILTLINSGVSQ